MKKLILHIGTEKTGTTTIQSNLFLNSKEYSKYYYYPQSLLLNKNDGNHIRLCTYSLNEDKNDTLLIADSLYNNNNTEYREKIEENFSKEMKKCKNDLVVMSNEHLSTRLIEIEEISRLKQFLDIYFDEIKILVYLREQVSYLKSSYSTSIKFGNTNPIDSIKEFESNIDKYDYLLLLDKWAEVFGKDNIIPRIFDRELLYENDIFKDFCNVVSIPYKKSEVSLNKSLGLKKLLFLRGINKYIPYLKNNKINPQRYGIVSYIEQIKIDEKDYSLNIPKEYYKIYERSNNQLKEKYFPNNEIELFKIKEINEKKSLDELDLSDIYYMSAELFKRTNKLSNNLQHKLNNSNIDDFSNNYEEYIDVLMKKFRSIDKLEPADIFRDIAVFFESIGEIKTAYSLMKNAKKLRPEGYFISKKCNEYEIILGKSSK